MGDAEGVASYVTVNVPVWLANAVFCQGPLAVVTTQTGALALTVRATLAEWVSPPLVTVTTSVYEPGTNTLVTTWTTAGGWVLVRDALTMGPRRGEDTITPHTRPPADDDAHHMLVRSVLCMDGEVEVELDREQLDRYHRLYLDCGEQEEFADAARGGWKPFLPLW